MAKKPVITPVTDTINNAAAINANLNRIANSFDNTLSLDGSTPNAMMADIDMNSNDILNGGEADFTDITVAGTSLAAQVTAAADSASAASTSETNAAISEINAATSASQAAASFDEFDDIYLGVFISDPTLDNDGDALQEGAVYFNSATSEWKVYVSSAWVIGLATGAGALLATNNLNDVASVSSSRTNLNVDIAGTDNSTDVTLAGTPDYITIVGQVITRNQVDLTADVTGILPEGNLTTATTTTKGTVEKATNAEAVAGTQVDVYADVVDMKAAISASGIGAVVDTQTFLTSGTWTKPASGYFARICVWAGGGAGSSDAAADGGGGGGGAFVEMWIPLDVLAATETVTIGAGGPTTISESNGQDGGNSLLGTFIEAEGGQGGRIDDTITNNGEGGYGGSVVIGIGHPAGGLDDQAGTTSGNSGGGGGGLGNASNAGGDGGGSFYGGGGGGGSNEFASSNSSGGTSVNGGDGGAGAYGSSGTNTGSPGQTPSGGGGAGSNGGDGGAGADGKIIVEVY